MATLDIPDVAENEIPAPVSPITIWINLKVLGFVFNWFLQKYLPGYTARVTSEYRTAEHNQAVGGAANSAHVHGLARDFNLQQNGVDVPKAQEQALFEQYIKPNWPGYALWEGDHIHLNLSRKITTYAGAVGVAGVGILGYKVISSMGGSSHG